MNPRKNVILKKSLKLIFDKYRFFCGNENNGAIFLNSIPKSGTHLAHQLLTQLEFNDRYGFYASTPSWSMRLQDSQKAKKYLSKQLNKELISGHLIYSTEMESYLRKLCIPSVFIYRDPRAVFLSELNYLSNMNRWHKCHSYYSNCKSFEEKFELCLHGISEDNLYYPNFQKRISDYIGWISSDFIFKLRFEDILNKSKKTSIIDDLSLYIKKHLSASDNYELKKSNKLISPADSHTFTGLSPDRWRTDLTKSQISRLNHHLGRLISNMGYEI